MLAPATVLVAEDEPAVRDTAADMLRFGGWRAIAAAEEREALAALEMGGAIGVLLPDVVMPGMNGVELAREARRLCPGLSGLLASGDTGAKGIHRWGVLGNDTGTQRGFALGSIEFSGRLGFQNLSWVEVRRQNPDFQLDAWPSERWH